MFTYNWLRKVNDEPFKAYDVSSLYSFSTLEEAIKDLSLTADKCLEFNPSDQVEWSHDSQVLTLSIYSESKGLIVHVYTIVEK